MRMFLVHWEGLVGGVGATLGVEGPSLVDSPQEVQKLIPSGRSFPHLEQKGKQNDHSNYAAKSF